MGQQRDFWSTKIRDRSRWLSVGDKDEKNSNACTVKSTRDLPMQTRKSNRYGHLASIRMPADRRPPSLYETESVYARRTTSCVLTGDGPESRAQRPAGQMVVSNYEPSA